MEAIRNLGGATAAKASCAGGLGGGAGVPGSGAARVLYMLVMITVIGDEGREIWSVA